jgi:hypothetical protein
MPRISFIWNYRGHNGGFCDVGPNWIQFTVPSSRKRRRCSLILEDADLTEPEMPLFGGDFGHECEGMCGV